MRIRFRKILPDGRSVRFEKDKDDKDIMTLNIIVWKDSSVRSRA